MRRTLIRFAFWLVFGAAAPAAMAAGYGIDTGDKIRVAVHDWPDITGEFNVSADGTLFLPVIGEISVRGQTVSNAAAAIASELQRKQKLIDLPSATAEITQYRPYYALGDVQMPGSFPYRPGLTVLQAVGVAGGYYRLVDIAALRAERDAIVAKGDIELLRERRLRLQARQIRLAAEQSGANTLSFPAEWNKDVSSTEAQLVKEEFAIFSTNKDNYAQQIATFDRFHKLYDGEVESIKSQIASMQQQFGSVEDELKGVADLVDKGLVQKPRKQSLERTLAQVAGNVQGLNTLSLQAQQNISQTEQAKLDAQALRSKRINDDQQATRAELDDISAKIATAKRLVYEAQVTTPDSMRTAKPRFTIARKGKDTPIHADAATALEPGDVLTVERGYAERSDTVQN